MFKFPCRVKIAPSSNLLQTIWVTVHNMEQLKRIQKMRYEILEIQENEKCRNCHLKNWCTVQPSKFCKDIVEESRSPTYDA